MGSAGEAVRAGAEVREARTSSWDSRSVEVEGPARSSAVRPEAVVLSYERYLQLAGGRERVAAALDRQTQEAGAGLDADAALELANSELHAMRRERAQGS